MKKFYSLLLALMLVCLISPGSSAQPSGEPQKWFDFWIGDWDLKWTYADGTEGIGSNKIERVLDDKVIKENFEGLTGAYKGYIGKSWSVWDVTRNNWYQTWVDSSGGYLDFHAEFDGEKRMFVREYENPEGQKIMQRMVFYDIKEDSFMWDWENSTDGGESWNLAWQISYTRKG